MTFIKATYGKNISFKLLLCFFSLGNLALTACATPKQAAPVVQDTIIPSKKDYQGYRLQLTSIKVTKSKGNQRKISCTLINTGREKVRLPANTSTGPNVVIQYDKTLADNGLEGYKNSLERALLKKKFSLDVGKISSNFELKFNISEEQLAENGADEKKAVKSTNEKEVNEKEVVYDFSLCPDLKLDTVFVIKRSRKTVELAFKITNYGEGPAAMFGETEATDDNVAIRAYASGTAKLSRGDLIMGGAFIEGGMEDKNGVLMPKESFSGSFTVESRKKTRHMPYFILSIDDYQALWECDERNNVYPLLDKNK